MVTGGKGGWTVGYAEPPPACHVFTLRTSTPKMLIGVGVYSIRPGGCQSIGLNVWPPIQYGEVEVFPEPEY